MNIGILALQGAFAAHQRVLTDLGASVTLVRGVEDVNGLDGIVLPGGESTTMSMLLDSSGIAAPLREHVRNGFPVFGTCAGLILLAEKIIDGRADQQQLGGLAITALRNGYGRQIDSFEASITICEIENTFARTVCLFVRLGSKRLQEMLRCWVPSTAMSCWSGRGIFLVPPFIPSSVMTTGSTKCF